METLSQQLANNKAMRRRIMRRVWYAFVLSIVLRPALALGFLFGASMIAFWKLVSITSIVENLLQVRLGEAPTYVVQSVLQAEFINVAVFGILLIVGTMVTLRLLSMIKFAPVQRWQSV